jgi:sugar/nucleoside kinase (ribokinase family)
MPPSICIIGDLMLDVVTHLDHSDPMKFEDLKQVTNAVEMLPGGTGVMAALAATQQGFSEVSLIGRIGSSSDGKPDFAAQIILNELNQAGVQSMLSKDTTLSTGTVMITYFSQDRRILVGDKGANGSFTMEDITPSLLRKVATADILFVSGYSLLVAEQARAIVRLTEEAKKHGRVVVLDVVPHKIYETINSLLFTAYTQHVGVLVSEINTIKRLFLETTFHRTIGDEREIAKHLLQRYDAVILRSNNDRQVIFNKIGLIKEMITGYSEAEATQQRGYLDCLTMRSIFEYHDQLIPSH